MKTVILTLILGFSSLANAAPWNDQCVTFMGADIPKEERNQDNCPTGSNHWDRKAEMDALVQRKHDLYAQAQQQGIANQIAHTGVGYTTGQQVLPQVITTNVGNYVIGRSSLTGNINAIVGPNFRR
jgi:hypothetical protein